MFFAVVLVILGAMASFLGFRLAGTDSYLTRTPKRGFVAGTRNPGRAMRDQETTERAVGKALKIIGTVLIIWGIVLLVITLLSSV